MDFLVYAIRCIFVLLVSWAGVRIIGKKSIAEMTAYDLVAIMLLTTVAAEPLVYKIVSKATVGVFIIAVVAFLIGMLSLKRYFYNVDNRPSVLVVHGKIIEKELKRAQLNVPLLMSELRVLGYQNISDIAYAIIEPNGKMSVVPKSQARPLEPRDMSIPTAPVQLSFAVIIDGEVIYDNLRYFKKDVAWLKKQLQAFNVGNVQDVFYAEIDSQGQLHVNMKNILPELPNIF